MKKHITHVLSHRRAPAGKVPANLDKLLFFFFTHTVQWALSVNNAYRPDQRKVEFSAITPVDIIADHVVGGAV